MIENRKLFFKPEQRLRCETEFDAVFSDPLRSRDQYFLLLIRKNNKSHSRIGLIVSKKKIRRAVSRNRVKRIVRDSFRLHQHQLPAVDVIILAYKHADEVDSLTLRHSLNNHWQKLKKKIPGPSVKREPGFNTRSL